MIAGRVRLMGSGVILAAVILAVAILSGCATSPHSRKDKFLAHGKEFMGRGDNTRALLEFRNAVKAMPSDPDSSYWAGMAFLGGGDFQNAAVWFQNALRLEPRHKDAKLRLAQLMAFAGDQQDIQAAEMSAAELAEAAPGDLAILKTLALAELKLGKTEDAVNSLRLAIASAPKNIAAYLLLAQTKLTQNDPKAAEEVLKQAAAAAPTLVDPYLALGRIYISQKRVAEAEGAIRHAIRLHPKNVAGLRDLAALQNDTGRKAEAEANFKRLSMLGLDNYKTIYGAFLLEENRRDEAVREFGRILKEDPDNRSARGLLIGAYLAMQKTADAKRLLDAALKKNSRDLDALLQRSQISIAAKQYRDALVDLNLLLNQKPDSAEAYYWTGKAHQGQGKILQYRQDLFKSLELNPLLLLVRVETAGALIDAGQPKAALSLLDLVPKDQSKSLALLIRRNWALWAAGDMAEMRQGIDTGLTRARVPELLIQDGMWNLQAGNAVQARASLEEALRISPGDLRALGALKDSYLLQRQTPLAVEKVKQYAAQQPKSAPAQEFLGFILWGSGDREAARTAFSAAKAADPQFTHGDLALAQLDVVEKKWDDAATRLSAVLAANPGNSTARLWLGDIQVLNGNLGPALDNFRQVVETNSENPQALNNFAYLLSEHANKPQEALKYAEQAVERAPRNAEYNDTLGWILYRKGLYHQALTKLKQAASYGNNPIAKYHLAMAYAKTGDSLNSQLVLAEAMKQNPNIPEARMAAEVVGTGKLGFRP